MTTDELLQKIHAAFRAYLAGTAALEEAFADSRHWVEQAESSQRVTVVRDNLWEFAARTDVAKGPLSSGERRNLATVLVVRLWAALDKADELPVYVFDYIRRMDRKWHSLWADVLHELRTSVGQYRLHFSPTIMNAIAEHCRLIQQGDDEQVLKSAAHALLGTVERIEYESLRPQAKAVPIKKEGKFGPWTIINSLSEGGQGRTFLVKTNADTTVRVLKELKNPERLDRFRKEVKAGLSLDHANIVKVIDHHLESKPYYLVTEYCERGALEDWAGLTDLSLTERLKLFLGICAGVAFAHRAQTNIIHRDLKPANVFIRADGSPAVGDFGICHITEEGERVTLLDEAVGPRKYMAPELEDGRVDQIKPHSDVYSLGKVLYWILERRNFAREKHREPEFDLTKKTATADYFLINELLDRMIVDDPAKRLKDANDVAYAVEALIERIQLGGHVMDLSAPQKCLYCVEGHYKVIAEPLYGQEEKSRDVARNLGGLGGTGTPLWGVFVCHHCGNVQLFRPDHARDPQVWKKS